MSLEFEYRTDSVGKVPEDKLSQWAEDTGLEAEKVVFYGAEGPAVYLGRDGDRIGIGVGRIQDQDINDHYLAHELGHALHDQTEGIYTAFDEDDLKLNDEGEIVIDDVGSRNDSLNGIVSELYGYFFGDKLTSESVDAFEFNPFDNGSYKEYADKVSGEGRGDHEITLGAIWSPDLMDPDRTNDTAETVKQFRPLYAPQSLPYVLDDIREINKGIDHEEPNVNTEDPVELLYGTWIDRLQNTDEDIFFETLRPYLERPEESDLITEEEGPDNKIVVSQDYRDDTVSSLANNIHGIVEDLETEIEEEIDEKTTRGPTKIHTTPNPSHFSELVKSGRLHEVPTNFTYKIGAVAGHVLSRAGVDKDAVMDNPDQVKDYAEFALETSIEMSVRDILGEDLERPTTKEYADVLRWWIDEEGDEF